MAGNTEALALDGRSSGSAADALLANITAVIANAVKSFIVRVPDIQYHYKLS